MIHETLSSITNEMNSFFKEALELKEDIIVLSGIRNQDGTVAIPGENKLVISLVHILEDKSIRIQAKENNTPAINLHMLVSAYFSANNYAEALKFIDLAMVYFRDKPVFARAADGDIPERRVLVTLENTDIETMKNIWTMMGASYMPSLLYRLRVQ